MIEKEENKLSRDIIGAAIEIHKEFGPGLLESVYEEALDFELRNLGHLVERQKPVPVNYKGKVLGVGFRADLIVNQLVIVEIKSIESLTAVHPKQVLTYLRLLDLKLGLLINFNESLLKTGIKRVVNNL